MRIHHFYVETSDWVAASAFWCDLGFTVAPGWGQRRDGILVSEAGGPYVFLRETASETLRCEVVFASKNLDGLARRVGAEPRDSGWGPRLLDVTDPDGRQFTVRDDDAGDE